MKKALSLIMAIVFAFSLTACGEIAPTQQYEKVSTKVALQTSPELNIQDTFYSTALKSDINALFNWNLKSGDMLDTKHSFNILAEEIEKGIEKTELTPENYFSVYNLENWKDIATNPRSSKSISNRVDWAVENQFAFEYHSSRFNVDGFGDTHSFLAVIYDFDKLSDNINDVSFWSKNPYYNSYNQTDNKPAKAELTGPYNYEEALVNLDRELGEMKTTVQNYLEQKYLGEDKGVAFGDYILKYCSYEDVKSFMDAQELNVSEIKDVVFYANPLTFHPFVEVEYTLVIDGTEHSRHEIYFLEIDKDNSGFVYKIAYVANYNSGSPYNIETLREHSNYFKPEENIYYQYTLKGKFENI